MQQVTIAPTFTAWQTAARKLLAADEAPANVAWEELMGEQPPLSMFEEAEPTPDAPRKTFRVPRAFLEIASRVACHREPQRWALLYRLLWRLTHGEPRLLEITVDPDTFELTQLDKAIRHDVHKMRAFVRFRRVPLEDDSEWFVAWFEPENHIVERNADFFVSRFAAMRWSILTPERCVHWNGAELSFTEGVAKSEAPTGDEVESLWRTYYGHIFNPNRVKIHAMQAEMPKRYWKNLPEAQIIPALLEEAPRRSQQMLAASASQPAPAAEDDYSLAQPPATKSWKTLQKAACACQACPLWRHATQTVFGEGPDDAPLVLVGEQPGDSEDREGHPFIGPAGMLLDRALAEAGIDRQKAYVTNAVKHFKWEPRGKRRLHQTPNSRDIAACRPWLEAELNLIKPAVLLCLGGTAAKSVVGPAARVMRDRGHAVATPFCEQTVITVHPSSLLRAPDEAAREASYALFIKDLRIVAKLLDRAAR